MKRNAIRIALSLSFIGSLVFATPAFAAGLTESQIQAIISLLQSFGADATTVTNVNASLRGNSTATIPSTNASATASCAYAWTRDLEVGSSGVDVKALQQFLNANGALVALSGAGSVGSESLYFGAATKAALLKFQTAHAIAPATGYFGPITRGKVAALCTGTSSTSNVSVSTSSSGGGTFVERAQGSVTSTANISVTSSGTTSSSSPTCALSIGFTQTGSASGSSTSLELIWTSTNTTGGTITPGIGAVGTSGSLSVAPTTTTLYTATFTGPNGAASCNATVNANQ